MYKGLPVETFACFFSAPSRDAIIAAYSRRGIAPTSLARRPHARIHDDDEDEYDPEMDDFIDDCEDGIMKSMMFTFEQQQNISNI